MRQDGNIDTDGGVPPVPSRTAPSGNRVRAATIVAGSLWVVAMAIWYVWTVAGTLLGLVRRIPFRNESKWLVVLVAATLFVAALCALIALQLIFRRLPIMRACLLATSLIAVTCILLRQQTRSAFVVGWILLVGYLWADWLLRKGGARPSGITGERVEWVAVSMALGLALLSPLALVLGLAGLLRPWPIVISLCLLTAVQLGSLRRLAILAYESVRNARGYLKLGEQSPGSMVLKFVLGLIALFNLTWALSPELSFDALNYQLAVPRFYLESGAIVDLPYFWHSYFARLVNGLFLFAMALGGQIAAKLLIYATGLIAATAVYALARTLLSRRAGLWAAAIFYSTPLVSWLSTVTYVDVTLAMFVITAWLAFLRWRKGGGIAWILASGALAGAVVGTKPSGVYALPVIIAVLVWESLRRRRHMEGLRYLVGFSLAATIIAFPWYLITWRFTGNPVFPLMNGVFKSPYWAQVNITMSGVGQFGVGNSLGALVRLPFALTFESRLFDEVLPSGGLGLALVLLPLGFFRIFVARRRTYLLVLASTLYFLLWGLSFQYARFYVPILPLVAALAITGVVEWAASGWPRKLNLAMLWVVFVSQGLLIPTAFGDIVNRNPLQLVTRSWSEEEFLGRAVLPYRAIQFLNRVTQPGDWVIGEGVDSARYYLRPQLVSVVESAILRDMLLNTSEEGLAAAFARQGYRYLIINRFAGKAPWLFLQSSFLERFATMVYRYNFTEVYSLHETQSEKRAFASTNYLSNVSFEEPAIDGRPAGWIVRGKFALEESRAHVGRWSICVTPEGDVRQRVAVVGGELYTLSHYARADLPGQEARMQINWLDNNGRGIDVSIEVVPVGDAWTWNRMTITAPEGAKAADTHLSVHKRGTACFDDIWFGAGIQTSP